MYRCYVEIQEVCFNSFTQEINTVVVRLYRSLRFIQLRTLIYSTAKAQRVRINF